ATCQAGLQAVSAKTRRTEFQGDVGIIEARSASSPHPTALLIADRGRAGGSTRWTAGPRVSTSTKEDLSEVSAETADTERTTGLHPLHLRHDEGPKGVMRRHARISRFAIALAGDSVPSRNPSSPDARGSNWSHRDRGRRHPGREVGSALSPAVGSGT